MFEQVAGIPAHPLLVHAAVVFVPLLALASIVYAVAPPLRRRVGWVVALLVPAGIGSTFVSRESGEAFEHRLIERGASGEILTKIGEHEDLAKLTWWVVLALGAVMAIFLLLTLRRRAPEAPKRAAVAVALQVVLAIAAVGLSAASLYYVVLTGDSGAHLVWSGS